jgi:hypothetical protein
VPQPSKASCPALFIHNHHLPPLFFSSHSHTHSQRDNTNRKSNQTMHLPTTATILTLLTLTTSSLLPKRQDLTGTSISAIGSARRSAFYSASAAFVAATHKPNSIVCPGVIGAAPTPSESPFDDVRLRTDPGAISALEQRQGIRPHQSREGGRRSRRSSTRTNSPEVVEARETGVVSAS